MRKTSWFFSVFLILLSLAIGAGELFAPGVAQAGDDEKRDRFQGVVEHMPEELYGNWVVGGRQITTSPRTEFDQVDGPLLVGGCAKVEFRNGIVHEIDSEPDEDCR